MQGILVTKSPSFVYNKVFKHPVQMNAENLDRNTDIRNRQVGPHFRGSL